MRPRSRDDGHKTLWLTHTTSSLERLKKLQAADVLSKGQIEPQKGWKTRGVSSPCAQAFYTIAAAIAHGRRREPALEASPKLEGGLNEY